MTLATLDIPASAIDAPSPLSRLLAMLAYRRPANSEHEANFIAKFIEPAGAEPDDYGNYWLLVGDASRVLWSSHTDTVHTISGIQSVELRKFEAVAPKSSCLGADCTVGVWIMLEMIAAEIPGCYVFHRAEEIGGHGSDFISRRYSDVLSCYDFAIAFDRRGCKEIITHQMGRRCASDAFAASLAPMLPKGYAASNDGIFTDTANYADQIAECTNLSVGYRHEHSALETLDLVHALRLRDAMLKFDESRLVKARDPATPKPDLFDAWGYDARDATRSTDYHELLAYCRRNPDVIADFLETQGFGIRDLEDHAGFDNRY